MIGFFGYDLAPRLERLPRKAPRDSRLPDIRMALYDTVVTVDHASGAVELWAYDLLGEGAAAAEAPVPRLAPGARPRATRAHPAVAPRVRWRATSRRDDYLDAVARALEYIAAGDIFQVNLSQRFTAHGTARAARPLPAAQGRSPAPFAAFLRWDDLAVAQRQPGVVLPDAGRPARHAADQGDPARGARPPEDDARLAAELAASPKDRAELTMIVDLERNDLGRVCRYGTVRVIDPLAVETFAQVHHLVATIEGRLRPGAGPIDVVRALFPGGSITGAPKIRAMEIIDELEPTRRSLYTGAIGYFSRGGTSGFNIAIRTMLVEGDRVSYQVGGGIVADSDPEAEYRETLHKGRGLRAVIEGEGGSAMIWVDGRIVPDDELSVSVLDRTFEHGLGLFETLRTWSGHATLLRSPPGAAAALGRGTRPAARSRRPARRRGRRRPCSVRTGVEGDAMLRITLTGGLSDDRTARPSGCARPRSRRRSGTEGAVVALDSWEVAPSDPLARHKTLNYWERRRAFEEARRAGSRRGPEHGTAHVLLGREPDQPLPRQGR